MHNLIDSLSIGLSEEDKHKLQRDLSIVKSSLSVSILTTFIIYLITVFTISSMILSLIGLYFLYSQLFELYGKIRNVSTEQLYKEIAIIQIHCYRSVLQLFQTIKHRIDTIPKTNGSNTA